MKKIKNPNKPKNINNDKNVNKPNNDKSSKNIDDVDGLVEVFGVDVV